MEDNEEVKNVELHESILKSIKKLLGVSEDNTDFDSDIIMHINTVFVILNQLGVGFDSGYQIESKDNTWDEFIQNKKELNSIKSYIFLKVKLLFDPPLSTATQEAIKNNIAELEWRLNFGSEF